MQTDWLVVRRLAAELDRAVRGARIRGAGRSADGRFGIELGDRNLYVDAFGATPIITLGGPLPLERTAGWVRTAAAALEGLRIERVRARRGDRLIALECRTQSRFGVSDGYRLVAELVPRFGNVLLLKDQTIVAAAKEFTRAENPVRAIVGGDEYEPPPLPAAPATALPLPEALAALARADAAPARRGAIDALRAQVPLAPRLAAESLVLEGAGLISAGAGAAVAAERCIVRASSLVAAADGESDAMGDVFCYWRGQELTAASVVPLLQFDALRQTREPSLLGVLAGALGAATAARAATDFERRRSALVARLAARTAALAAERAALERERDDGASRDVLRRSGEALYAHANDVPPGATTFVPPSDPELAIALDPELDAKGNAAAIFRRYRKAVAKLAHTGDRLAQLSADAEHAAELAWELERADAETLADVAEAIDRLERKPKAANRGGVERRKPLSLRLADDARVYVGRSPRGNADLTFRIARPDDLWFHARETPGAHVVLHLDSARAATAGELERAASLAAFHSKARSSEKVAVDYTERKFVRRRRDAPPGLVWYTNARTVVAAPADAGGAAS